MEIRELVKGIEKDKVYSTKEVANILGVSVGTVRYWIKKKWLKGFRIGGRFKVSGEALIEFLKNSEK